MSNMYGVAYKVPDGEEWLTSTRGFNDERSALAFALKVASEGARDVEVVSYDGWRWGVIARVQDGKIVE